MSPTSIVTFLGSIVFDKLLDKSIDIILKYLSSYHYSMKSSKTDIVESLNLHLKQVLHWAEEINFKDSPRPLSLNDVYIDLDLYVYPKRQRSEDDVKIDKIKIKDIDFDLNIALLGMSGAGKTTSLKKICFSILTDDKFSNFNYPILVRLRDLPDTDSQHILLNELKKIFQLTIFTKLPKEIVHDIEELSNSSIIKFIDSQNILLIFDGFDELSNDSKISVLNDIRLLANSLETSRFIVSSRDGDFQYSINRVVNLEIAPLIDEQVREFTNKWLGNSEAGQLLYNKITDSPFYDLSIRPITIALLCALYKKEGDIPKKPKTIYRKVVNLLLEEWDLQNSVKRGSEYANLEGDRKFEFLTSLAFHLTTYVKSKTFNTSTLESAYNRIYFDFDLPLHQSRQVALELENHTGIITKNSFDKYEFVHSSIQEFLTASYLVKLYKITPNDLFIDLIPEELAITIAIASNPSDYLINIINDIVLPRAKNDIFIYKFTKRLMFEKPDLSHKEEVIFTLSKVFKLCDDTKIFSSDIYTMNNLSNLLLTMFHKNDTISGKINANYIMTRHSKSYYTYSKRRQCVGPKKFYLPIS